MAQGKQTSLIRLRIIAVKTLAQVLHSNLSLDEALMSELHRNTAQMRPEFDRSWIYEICSGVLRYKGRLDFIIDTYALKKKPSGPIRRYLYTAVYQLIAQDTPSALIVSETVHAVREQEGDAPSKFVNALLRKVSDSRDQWKNWKISEASSKEEQMAWCSLPEWFFKKMIKQYGFAFTCDYARASLERPVTWYRNLETQKSEILPEGFQGSEQKGFVQDISNQKLVEMAHEFLNAEFAKAIQLGNKPKILDLCSAPGGKSMALAALGWSVVATDKDPQRLQKVTENKNRLQFKDQEIEIADYAAITASDSKWPVIWLDVPCMSLGIIRRHPEIKWNRGDKDLPALMQKQKDLIKWAKSHLSAEGVLIYSSCSPLKEENPPEIDGLKPVKAFESYPQNAPHGDCILGQIYLNTTE